MKKAQEKGRSGPEKGKEKGSAGKGLAGYAPAREALAGYADRAGVKGGVTDLPEECADCEDRPAKKWIVERMLPDGEAYLVGVCLKCAENWEKTMEREEAEKFVEVLLVMES